MAGLVPAIHVFLEKLRQRRGDQDVDQTANCSSEADADFILIKDDP
jgi:hypothetical protein